MAITKLIDNNDHNYTVDSTKDCNKVIPIFVKPRIAC